MVSLGILDMVFSFREVVYAPPVAKPWSSSPPAKFLAKALINYVGNDGTKYGQDITTYHYMYLSLATSFTSGEVPVV